MPNFKGRILYYEEFSVNVIINGGLSQKIALIFN